ncbi:hypothetical protein [Sinorhizobium americanum]|uniref:hypothetical protein n=1 Tax=Sinorhizobium americanum TaxID=194963 RepID=UPI0007D91AE1|nr:hypothetical protein [Sinorhizobium americanum]OAP34803.1 hypothetical protein ATC00_15900 [Sinorhizobium americanum]
MPEDFSWEVERPSTPLFIHFDVEDHHIKLDTFIQTADSARRIIDSLDQALFGGGLDYELVVLPPESGSFLQRLAVLLTTAAAVVVFLDSDTPAGFIEGLTGKPTSAWMKELGSLSRETIEHGLATEEPTEDEVNNVRLAPPDPTREELACRSAEKFLTTVTRAILEKETHELVRLGMDDGELVGALDARADFYAACFNDGDVKRVGFTPDDTFPIPRNSFPGRSQKPIRKEGEEDPPEWIVAIESINVTSPNWVQEDQRTRQWKGKDASRRDCYFVIEDAEFWRLVKMKNLQVEVWDSLKVQWAYRVVDGKAKQRRVLRVLEFNGTNLATPLPPDAINAILGDHSSATGSRAEPSLFEGW